MELILNSSLLFIYHIFSIIAIIWAAIWDMPSDDEVSTWSSSHHQHLLQEWRYDLHCSCCTLLCPGPHCSSCTVLYWQSQGCGAQMSYWRHRTGSLQENPLNSRTHCSKMHVLCIMDIEILCCFVDLDNCFVMLIHKCLRDSVTVNNFVCASTAQYLCNEDLTGSKFPSINNMSSVSNLLLHIYHCPFFLESFWPVQQMYHYRTVH